MSETNCKFDFESVETALSLLGGKWRLLVLSHLIESPKRFGALRDMLGVSEKVLTQQLKSLVAEGLVIKTVFPVSPPHVEYALTPYGATVEPVCKALMEWGKTHRLGTVARNIPERDS